MQNEAFCRKIHSERVQAFCFQLVIQNITQKHVNKYIPSGLSMLRFASSVRMEVVNGCIFPACVNQNTKRLIKVFIVKTLHESTT